MHRRTVFRTGFLLSTGLLLISFVGCGGGSDPAPADPSPETATSPEPAASATDGSETEGSDTKPMASPGGNNTTDQGVENGNSSIELPEITEQPNSTPADASEGGDFKLPDVKDSSQSAGKVDVEYATWESIEQRAKSTGKITVVDLWSTVCEPCVKEFPGLVRLDKSMRSTVTCIGVDVDYDGRKKRPPESYADRVTAFLEAVGAEFDNFICSTPSDEVYAQADLPSIPAVLVFDAEGNLVKRFVDAGETIGFSYDKDVIPLVKSL